MNDTVDKGVNWGQRWKFYTGLGLGAAGLFLLVYLLATPEHGSAPPLPTIELDQKALDFAITRLGERAESVEIGDYQRELLKCFEDLNFAEMGVKTESRINKLRYEFEQKSLIPSTADKERFILLGDWAAVEFEGQLARVLSKARGKGLEALIKSDDADYRELIKLGGSFLSKMVAMGIVTDSGDMLVPKYIPQILFRRRWRMLGGIPFRYNFLEIEALVDNYFILKHTNPKLVDERLRAVRAVKRYQPEFDEVVARAIVYYEGGEKAKAIAVLEASKKRNPESFGSADFLRFLENK